MFPRTRSTRSILGMDYNFKVGGLTGAEVREMYDRVVERAYAGDRHPVFFCHHFSRWQLVPSWGGPLSGGGAPGGQVQRSS